MSQGYAATQDIAAILLENVQGAVNVIGANQRDDLTGVDYWVIMSSGTRFGVDCKVRAEDWATRGADDLALETWSMIEQSRVGWTRDDKKKTDYVLWLWRDTGRWCLLPFVPLRTVFSRNWQRWATVYGVKRQANKNYTSECIFVPRRIVWRAIYDLYGGATD